MLQTTRLPLAAGATGFASEMLCGGAVLMLISLAMDEHFSGPVQPLAAAAWLYLVVFGSLIAFSAYLYLLANASPAMATSYAFVNPLIALFFGCRMGLRERHWRRVERLRRGARGRFSDLQRENEPNHE